MTEFRNCPKCNFSERLDPAFRGAGECERCLTKWKGPPRAKAKRAPRKRRCHRADSLRRKYGLTVADYDALAAKQGGVCAICKGSPRGRHQRLVVDHCHTTGRIRGLLCTSCNAGLGMMRDSSATMMSAIRYLQEQ